MVLPFSTLELKAMPAAVPRSVKLIAEARLVGLIAVLKVILNVGFNDMLLKFPAIAACF